MIDIEVKKKKIRSTILSCKTIDQLNSALEWIQKLNISQDQVTNDFLKSRYYQTIEVLRTHLKSQKPTI